MPQPTDDAAKGKTPDETKPAPMNLANLTAMYDFTGQIGRAHV